MCARGHRKQKLESVEYCHHHHPLDWCDFSTYRAFIRTVTQLRNSHLPYYQPCSEKIQWYGVSQASSYTSVWFQKGGAKSHKPRISMDFPRVTPHPRATHFSIRSYSLASMISELDNLYQANGSYFPDMPSNEWESEDKNLARNNHVPTATATGRKPQFIYLGEKIYCLLRVPLDRVRFQDIWYLCFHKGYSKSYGSSSTIISPLVALILKPVKLQNLSAFPAASCAYPAMNENWRQEFGKKWPRSYSNSYWTQNPIYFLRWKNLWLANGPTWQSPFSRYMIFVFP